MENKMSRSYPIWNETRNPSYSTDKSNGARDYTRTDVKVGTSATNSYNFVTHETRVSTDEKGTKTFEFLIDGRVFKQATLVKGRSEIMFSPLYNGKDGRWGKL